MTVLSPQPKMQFTTAAGVPLSGGKVYTYIAGTTTPQATFTDYTGATPNTNPVILNSRGEANIWLGGALYKFKLTDANDVEIWTVDYISAPTSAVSPVLSGSVTIDSDTPGPALKITQTGTGPVMRVQDSADPDTTPFIIDTNGNLGLGTATPTAQLEATGAAKIGSLTLTSAPLPIASGGTGAADAATARANLGTATSGAVTASGLTMATSRLLGRTTAGAGAIEEISVGSGLSLTGGTLASTVSVPAPNRQVFTSSGTWTKPSGYSADTPVIIEVWGGGGGGSSNASGGGGGGGAYSQVIVNMGSLGATETITVGTGGATGFNGVTGGTSSFGSLLSAFGGAGGLDSGNGGGGGGGALSSGSSTTGGRPAGGDAVTILDSSFGGGSGGTSTNAAGWSGYGGGGGGRSAGGRSVWGGGGGEGSFGGGAGTSSYGGNGGASGSPGVAPAGGGGRNAAGARGEVRVTVTA